MKCIEKTPKNLHKEIYEIIKNNQYESHLDIGCGTGALIKRLKGNVKKSFGTDINKKEFKLKGVDFEKADLNKKFPFKNEKFDLITAVEIIEHVENQFSFIREAAVRLNKKGKFILTSPNIYNIWSKLFFLFKNRFINFLEKDLKEHINPVIDNILLHTVKQNKLKLIKKSYSSCHIPYINLYIPIKNRFLGNVAIYLFEKY